MALGHTRPAQCVWLLLTPSALLRLNHRSLSSESISRSWGQFSPGPRQALPGKRLSWPVFTWLVLVHCHTWHI